MRCLLVDDEEGIREGLAAFLRLRGHEVRTAADAAAAAAWLLREPFDLVCTDWRLPDGTAAALLQAAPCPVIVISGWPEEVPPAPRLRAVLGKPVAPARLCALVQELAPGPAAPAALALADLPQDVRRVVGAALAALDQDAAELVDDGAFVTLRAPWPGDHLLPAFAGLGGDLRILAPDGQPRLELRLCRDGRADPSLPVVRAGEDWPDVSALAVDFDGVELAAAAFDALLDRAAPWRAAGRQLQFLNVPAALLAAAGRAGRGADLPDQLPIGPRLPAVLADLWS